MEDKIDELLAAFNDAIDSMKDATKNMGITSNDNNDNLKSRFDILENRVDDLENEMNNRFDKLDEQYKNFMKDLRTIKRMAAENLRDVQDIDERVENLEAS